MYSVTVRTDFIAQHYLIGGDWGPENERNSHHYVLELQLDGTQLDQHGYLVDIVQVEAELRDLRAHYTDRLLNDLPEFAGLNPSIAGPGPRGALPGPRAGHAAGRQRGPARPVGAADA